MSSINKVSKNFLKMVEIYYRFGNGFTNDHTFTEEDKIDLYNHETFGTPLINNKNGYVLGKKIMDISVAMWREDISRGHLSRYELYQDYPDWWLDKVLFRIKPDTSNTKF